MLHSIELAFIDPAVDDVAGLLRHLRAGVRAVVLDARRPAAAQMAEAVRHCRDLAAIHVVAHGAPGRVEFAIRRLDGEQRWRGCGVTGG